MLSFDRSLRRIRHFPRYREIIAELIGYGFGDMLHRFGLINRLSRFRGQSQEETDNILTAPERFRLLLESLGPTFIKLGQILSTRPDILPPEYIAEMARLQDRVPPSPWGKILNRIEDELGAPWQDIFAEIDPVPLGSASLAQVHVAKLKDGTEVVVKVQRPNIESLVQTDLEILQDLADFVDEHTGISELYDLPEIAEDFTYTMKSEMNYRREATHADRFRRNFEGNDDIYIPTIHWDYVTGGVLVMERIEGIKIDNIEALREAGHDPREVVDRAAGMIVKEVLIDGFFHADPHPGNIFVMANGALGVMDFGMVGWLQRDERYALMQIYIAAMDDDGDALAEHLIQLDASDQIVDRDSLDRDVFRLLRKYRGLPLSEFRIQDLLDDLMPISFKHKLRLPSDLWILARAFAIMEGVGTQLDPDFDVFAASDPYLKQLRREMLLPKTWWPPLKKHFQNWADLLNTLPRASEKVLRSLEKGQFTVNVAPEKADPVLDRLEEIADRIVLGLVVSAFIIALATIIPAMTQSSEESWVTTVFIFSFIAASVLGIWLMISILRGKGD
jgi:ubiquinone biosynthesis protein